MSGSRNAARRVWWTRSQATAWIMHRTEAAVGRDGPFAAEQEGVALPPIDLAALTALTEALDRPYPRYGRFITEPVDAVAALDAAIASGRVRESSHGELRSADMRTLWPSAGPGNAHKRHLEQEHVDRLARALRQTPKPRGRSPRIDLLQALAIGIGSEDRESTVRRLFAEGREVAIGSVTLTCCRCSMDHRLDCRAAELCISVGEADRQRGNIETWFKVGRPRTR